MNGNPKNVPLGTEVDAVAGDGPEVDLDVILLQEVFDSLLQQGYRSEDIVSTRRGDDALPN